MSRRHKVFSTMTRIGAMVLLLAGVQPVVWAEQADFDVRYKEARARLDEAAKQLASIYSEAMQVEVKAATDRAMLGVLLDEDGDERGLPLSGITPGSGAEQAGLRAGDVLTRIGDVTLTGGRVNPMWALSKKMKTLKPGDVIEVDYRRKNETGTVTVTTQGQAVNAGQNLKLKLSELNKEMVRIARAPLPPQAPRPPELAGALVDVKPPLADYFAVDSGVLVLEVPKQSELRPGDIILSLADQAIGQAWEAEKLLRKEERAGRASVSGEVMRKGKKRKLEVPTRHWPQVWMPSKASKECP